MSVRMTTSKKIYKFKQRFLRVEKVSAKTLETSSRHMSGNAESGRILDNSENYSRYLSFTEPVSGGSPPTRVCQRLRTRPLKRDPSERRKVFFFSKKSPTKTYLVYIGRNALRSDTTSIYSMKGLEKSSDSSLNSQ